MNGYWICIRNPETLAYLKDALRRQPRQTLKCFHLTPMRTGYFTHDVIAYLVTYLLSYLLSDLLIYLFTYLLISYLLT